MKFRSLAVCLVLLAPAHATYAESDQEVVRKLVAQLTLDEKMGLLMGQAEPTSEEQLYQAGYLPGVPRLGIPALRLADGPPGVATRLTSTGMTCTMGVAATFSVEDARRNGEVIGRDARVAGQDVLLEPFLNLDRDTSWGRGFNTFGEDPVLTGIMGAEEIRGIQSQGVLAQAKHLLAFDGAMNVRVDEQTLREVYLRPFEYAVQAGVASMMCAYNVLNGLPACGNTTLLTNILRHELGFRGFVTSDWGANHATPYLNAGLDMEMPGPGGSAGTVVPTFFDPARVKHALATGTIDEAYLDEVVTHILTPVQRMGLIGKERGPRPERDEQGNAAVVLKTAQHAATLLENDGILPLSERDLSSLVVIGPGGNQTIATNGGGEQAGGILRRQVGTVHALRERLRGTNARIGYSPGFDLQGVPIPDAMFSDKSVPGLTRLDLRTGRPTIDARIDAVGERALPPGSEMLWSAMLKLPETGDYWINIQALGATARLALDGDTIHTVGAGISALPRYGVVHPTDGHSPLPTRDGLANGRTLLRLEKGATSVHVEATPDVSGAPVQVRLSWVTPSQRRAAHDAAVEAAKKAHTAVVFVWSGGDLSKPLPGDQDQLVRDVAQVNDNTIVVLNTSQPVAMPWRDDVRAVLQMWYPGDEGGWATADVLLGRVSPSGHLPFTWPSSIEQTVAHQSEHPERSSSGVGGAQPCVAFAERTGQDCGPTTYSEGVHVGYRWFELEDQTPLYPFGYGLSYASFAYSGLHVEPRADGSLRVRFTVRNKGKRAADAVPQLYLGAPKHPPPGAQFALRALVGFTRVSLAPGASKSAEITVPARLLQYWSSTYGWQTASGPRTLMLGEHARHVALSHELNVAAR